MYIGKYGHISDAWGSITAFQLFWDRNTSYVTLHHSLKENRVGRESTFPRASRPQGWYCPPGTVDAVKTVGKNSESAGLSSNPDSTSYSCALNKLLNLSVSSALGYKVDIMKASNLGGLCWVIQQTRGWGDGSVDKMIAVHTWVPEFTLTKPDTLVGICHPSERTVRREPETGDHNSEEDPVSNKVKARTNVWGCSLTSTHMLWHACAHAHTHMHTFKNKYYLWIDCSNAASTYSKKKKNWLWKFPFYRSINLRFGKVKWPGQSLTFLVDSYQK